MDEYVEQEVLLGNDPIDAAFELSPIGIVGRKLQVWWDDDKIYGRFDLGFEEPVVVSFEKKLAVQLNDVDTISFNWNGYDNISEVAEEFMNNTLLSVDRKRNVSRYTVCCNRFYQSEGEGGDWYLPEVDRRNLAVTLESFWRQQLFQMEHLYTRKKGGFFFMFAGQFYFLPKGECLTFYRHGIWLTGFNSIFGQLAPYMRSAVSVCSEEQVLSRGLVPFLGRVRGLFFVLDEMLRVALHYVWSFRQTKDGKWFPFYKNLEVRYAVRTLYGYYLHVLLPTVARWDRILFIAESQGISASTIDRLLQQIFLGRLRRNCEILNKCDRIITIGGQCNSLVILKGVARLLNNFVRLLEGNRARVMGQLHAVGLPSFKFSAAGDPDKHFLNVITRRSLLPRSLGNVSAFSALKGVSLGGQRGSLEDILPAYNGFRVRKVVYSDSFLSFKFLQGLPLRRWKDLKALKPFKFLLHKEHTNECFAEYYFDRNRFKEIISGDLNHYRLSLSAKVERFSRKQMLTSLFPAFEGLSEEEKAAQARKEAAWKKEGKRWQRKELYRIGLIREQMRQFNQFRKRNKIMFQKRLVQRSRGL